MIRAALAVSAVAISWAAGAATYQFAAGRGRRLTLESAALGLPLGAVGIAAWMLLLSGLGVRLGVAVLALPPAAAAGLAALALSRRGPSVGEPVSRPPAAERLSHAGPLERAAGAAAVAVLALSLTAVTVEAVRSDGIVDWDGWAIWGVKSKAFFTDRSLEPYLARAQELEFSWPGRPCLSALYHAYVYCVIEAADERVLRTVHVTWYVSLLGLVFSALRPALGARWAAAFTAALAGAPNLADQATAGLANVVLATYALGSLVVLERWCSTGEWRLLPITTLLLGGIMLARDEGFAVSALVVSATLAAWFGRMERRVLAAAGVLVALVGAMALYALWLWRIQAHGVTDPLDHRPRITPARIARHLADVPELVGTVARELGDPEAQMRTTPLEQRLHVTFFWPMTAAAGALLLAGRRRRPPLVEACALTTVGGIAMYVAILWLMDYRDFADLADNWLYVLDRHVIAFYGSAMVLVAYAFGPVESAIDARVAASCGAAASPGLPERVTGAFLA